MRRRSSKHELTLQQINLVSCFNIFHSIPSRENVHNHPVNSKKLKALISQRIGFAIDNGNSVVDLSGLQLYELPSQVSELQHFVTFQRGVGVCSDVELHLSLNRLEIFPKELLVLKNLTLLNLSGNNITFLPSVIDQLVNLKELSVGNNKLEYLPCSLFNLKKLSIFNAIPNPFPSVPPVDDNSIKREATHIHFNPKLCLEEHCLRSLNQLDIRSITNSIPLPTEIQNLLKQRPKDRCSHCPNTFFNSAVDILKWLQFSRTSSTSPNFPFLYQFCSFHCKDEYIKCHDLENNTTTTIPI